MEDQPPIQGYNLKLDPRYFENADKVIFGRVPEIVTYTHKFERLEIGKNGGFYRFYKDCKYPTKGMVDPEIMLCIDMVKKYTVALAMSVAVKEIWLPALGFVFLGRKRRLRVVQRVFEQYCKIANYTLTATTKVYMKPEYYTEFAKAVRIFTTSFLAKLGISTAISENVAKIISNLVEYDDAYRYRAQDLFSTVTRDEMLKSPRKAIKKMLGIFVERDMFFYDGKSTIADKFKAFGNLLSYALIVPSIRKSFTEAMNEVDFSYFQLDDIDRYNVLLTTGYKYLGMNDDERITLWVKMHDYKIPERIKIVH